MFSSTSPSFFTGIAPLFASAANPLCLLLNISSQPASLPLARALCAGGSCSRSTFIFSCSARSPRHLPFLSAASADVSLSSSSHTSSFLLPSLLLHFCSASPYFLSAAASSLFSLRLDAAAATPAALPAAHQPNTSPAAVAVANLSAVAPPSVAAAGVLAAPASPAAEAALDTAPRPSPPAAAALAAVASARVIALPSPSSLAVGVATPASSPVSPPPTAAADAASVAAYTTPAPSVSPSHALSLAAPLTVSAPSSYSTTALPAAFPLRPRALSRVPCPTTAVNPFSPAAAPLSAAAAASLSTASPVALTAAALPLDSVVADTPYLPLAGSTPRSFPAASASVAAVTLCTSSAFSSPPASSCSHACSYSTLLNPSSASFPTLPLSSSFSSSSSLNSSSSFPSSAPLPAFSLVAPFPFSVPSAAPLSCPFPSARASSFCFPSCPAACLSSSPPSGSPSTSSASRPCAPFADERFARIAIVGAGKMGAGIGITAARHLRRSTVVVMDTSHLQLQQAQTAAVAYFRKEVARGRLTEEEALSCRKRLSFVKLEAAVFTLPPPRGKSSAASSLSTPPSSAGPPLEEACSASSRAASVAAAAQHYGSSSNFLAASLSSHSAAAAVLSAAPVHYKEAVQLAAAETPAGARCAAAREGEALSEAGAAATAAVTPPATAPPQQPHDGHSSSDEKSNNNGSPAGTKRQQELQQQQQLLCTKVPAFLREATFCIEAVWEDVTMKKAVFRYLDEATPPEAVLASNTSSISITKLAAATKRPEKVVGMHFMNPVPVMPLVEVIPGLCTSVETLTATESLAACMQKVTARALDRPGFIANRLLMPYLNEAILALQEGISSPEEIDLIMKLGTNVPLGPLELSDFIGLDVCLSIMRVLHEALGEGKYKAAPLLVQHVDAGFLGRKSGRGFYNYEKKKSR